MSSVARRTRSARRVRPTRTRTRARRLAEFGRNIADQVICGDRRVTATGRVTRSRSFSIVIITVRTLQFVLSVSNGENDDDHENDDQDGNCNAMHDLLFFLIYFF